MIFFTKASHRIPAEKNTFKTNIFKITGHFKVLVLMRFFFALLLTLLLVVITHAQPSGQIPPVPGPITGQVNVCAYAGTSQAVSYSIVPVTGATLYLWSVPPTVTILSGQGTTEIRVIFSSAFSSSANKQLRVRAVSEQGNSADRTLNLLSQLPSTPGIIGGPNNSCIYVGTSSQATYRIARDPAAAAYIWGTQSGTTVVTHPNGSGPNDTIINVTFKKGFTSSPVTVQAINNCGFSAARSLQVSGVAPSTPGPITGPTNVCPYMLPSGTPATYSINAISGASAYIWSVPANAVVVHPNGSGPNDNIITVQFPAGFTNGVISVIASSGCDDSPPRNLNVSRLTPSAPGIISGMQTIVCPNREYIYSIPAMPLNATSVKWTVPAAALDYNGQGSTAITVFYPETPIAGMITAQGVSNCASGSIRQAIVQIGRCQAERPGSAPSQTAAAPTALPGQKLISFENPVVLVTGDMEVKIFPNPTTSIFKLKVATSNKETINLRALDISGRELKRLTVKPNELTDLDLKLKPGNYMIEVVQGKEKKTTRVTKL